MTFCKLLEDSKFTGQPYKITEDDVRRIAIKLSWTEHDTEEALKG